MKKQIAIYAIISLSLLLSSCSTLSEFMIVNNSGSEIEVEYTVENIQNYEKPRLTTAEKAIDGGLKDWEKISEDDLKIDESARIINVKIPDGKAIIVAAEVNYLGHDEEDFSIEKIKITSRENSLNYEGEQAQQAFKKQENSDYLIIFR